MKPKIKNLDNKMLRDFGLVTGGITVILFGLLLPWLLELNFPVWPWAIAVALWSCALIYPRLLSYVYRGWMAIGSVLGWVNTRIILGLVFYVVIMPIGLLMRLFGKDQLALKLSDKEKSYRIKSKKSDKQQMERPF